MAIAVKLDKQRKVIVIKMPLERPRPSASGKIILIGTTNGLATGDATKAAKRCAVLDLRG